ncbi:MAG: cysteine desulfurase/selenocysteine lyase [Candidatus Endobugula sp.]|jgi:cysteine desulfurase/selenocysteine lyase
MNFDVEQFTAQFPLFSQAANQSLVYLDNAATTQKPQCVIDAISHFYLHQNGNAQRASHRLARAATDMVTQTRQLAAEFLGANSAAEVVFTSGATEAINIVAFGLASMCGVGDEIILTAGEHHANLLPWQRLAEQQQCTLVFLPADTSGSPDFSRWSDVVNGRTRIVAISAASNVLGEVIDFALLAQVKQRSPHVIIVLDASQIACHIPLQAAQWSCDFLVCSAHKFYGPTGIGLLYATSTLLERMPPLQVGGEMGDHVALQHSTFVDGVQRFEAGTSSLSAIAGLQACLLFWQQQNRPAMFAYERSLVVYLHHHLLKVCAPSTGLKLITSPKNNVGIATLVSVGDAFALSDLAYWLDENDIAVRVGQHCAQTLWQSLAITQGADNGLRISLAAYNTYQDMDRLVGAIDTFINELPSASLPVSSVVTLAEVSLEPTHSLGDDLSHLQWQDLLDAPSWQKRFKVLQQWGGAIQPKPHIRESQYLVKGCESLVWVQHQVIDNKHYFLIDSDANLIKGLSTLLLFWFNEKTTEEIQAVNVEEQYQKLGLEKYLSASRMNGFVALLERVKSYT